MSIIPLHALYAEGKKKGKTTSTTDLGFVVVVVKDESRP
jgi:hypothetical protein